MAIKRYGWFVILMLLGAALACYFNPFDYMGGETIVTPEDITKRPTLSPTEFWGQVEAVASYTPQVTVSPATTVPYQACAWQWASQDIPDLTAQFTAALDAQGIEWSQVRVYAFGENCLGNSGEVHYFAEMETDFGMIAVQLRPTLEAI